MAIEMLESGARVADRYVITRLLGKGGFGWVYEAIDELIGRQVAIKVFMPFAALGDDEQVRNMSARFLQEARTAASIDHPNVITIFDMGVLPGVAQQPYIVMEFLQGHDFQEDIERNGPMPAKRLWPLMIGALHGLARGHQQKIIHRDLKPANLFIHRPGPEEASRVLDFGIARLQNQKSNFTGTGMVVGTPQYIAPEYASRQLVSPALDVYQMGLILVEMLSGQAVVPDDNIVACIYLHTQGKLAIPDSLWTSPLGPVLKRSLALEPEDRYQDARQMADALQKIDPARMPAFKGSTPQVRISPANISASQRVGVTSSAPPDTLEQRFGVRTPVMSHTATAPADAWTPDAAVHVAAMTPPAQPVHGPRPMVRVRQHQDSMHMEQTVVEAPPQAPSPPLASAPPQATQTISPAAISAAVATRPAPRSKSGLLLLLGGAGALMALLIVIAGLGLYMDTGAEAPNSTQQENSAQGAMALPASPTPSQDEPQETAPSEEMPEPEAPAAQVAADKEPEADPEVEPEQAQQEQIPTPEESPKEAVTKGEPAPAPAEVAAPEEKQAVARQKAPAKQRTPSKKGRAASIKKAAATKKAAPAAKPSRSNPGQWDWGVQ